MQFFSAQRNFCFTLNHEVHSHRWYKLQGCSESCMILTDYKNFQNKFNLFSDKFLKINFNYLLLHVHYIQALGTCVQRQDIITEFVPPAINIKYRSMSHQLCIKLKSL